MSAALLLLAAAVCLAPWRGRAEERLAVVLPPRSRSRTGPGPVDLAGLARWGRDLRVAALARAVNRSGAADPGALAQLVDLLAAALTAGLPAADSLAAVADAVGQPHPGLAPPLRTAAARLRLGATPSEAWQEVPGAAALAPIAAVLVRATDGGGSVRAALEHAAGRLRSEADAAATARAERASVMVAGPLGLCFLPAFVCLGVLPVVVGLADGMLPEIGL